MSFNQREYQTVVLAALLHDIGKFMQRAEVPLSARSKGMENTLCRVSHNGRYTHKHVLWTNEFFELFQTHPVLGVVLEKDSICNLASFHHRPDTKLQEVIQLADWLSSGSDRVEDEEASDDRENYKKARMHSILEYMSIAENKMTEAQYRYELKQLDDNALNSFPRHRSDLTPKDGEKLTNSYGELWDAFREELEGLTSENTDRFTVSLLSLLEKYTWCMPSSTMQRPDISLFDHAKTTAAIAAALYLYHTDKGDIDTARLSINDEQRKFILLAGDISGIQNYIFNIKNVGVGGIAKRLRARSFYLSIVADIASHKLLHSFRLTITNLLMSSGGKFYLLLPNTSGAAKLVNGLKAAFDDWCINTLNGEISLNLAQVDLSCKEFVEFSEAIRKVNAGLQQVKNEPFKKYLTAEAGWKKSRFLFEGRRFESEESLCVSCGKFAGEYRDEQQIVMCDHCYDDVKLGQELTNAHGIQFFMSSTDGRYRVFDYSFSVMKENSKPYRDAYLVYQFNNWEFGSNDAALKPKYFANYIPVFDENRCVGCEKDDCKEQGSVHAGTPRFFTCIAEASRGRKMLGVFKADVDNLGLMFINGFRKGEKSISRITTLSRLLDTFFTGHLERLLREEFHYIYTVYAGGDDLLVLGPWDQVIRFGIRLREEFSAFCCHNPDFTLSAGAAVVKPKLPVYACVANADRLLKKAKHEKALGEDKPKNQLAVLDDCFKWDKAEAIMAEGEKLKNWQSEKSVSMGFIRQLLYSSEMYRQFRRTGETRCLRYVPLLAYNISRNIKKNEIAQWAQDLLDTADPKHKLNNLAFIANYSMTMNRS
ncbi:MAG TPA: type III-A CRISPR-associated protein Cas10/Csm1 [Proteobacteria bacterium]|nr:type III-A CRISPR-associated protein Cas10/Csm1 [Pseudomonadota bacterium]